MYREEEAAIGAGGWLPVPEDALKRPVLTFEEIGEPSAWFPGITMGIGIYGLFTEDELGGLRGVFWACHRGVGQPKVGSATVLSWNLWSLWPLAIVLCPILG